MASTLLSQSQNALPNLNTNVSFTNPVQAAQMEVQSLAPISKVGDALINKGVEIYSKDQQQKAINQAYQDASEGKFGTVAGITGANEKYNDVMNNVAPAIMVSKAGAQLDNLYTTIKLDPNFSPQTATQQYAKGAKGIIDAYTNNEVPEQWRSQVSLTMQKQAVQYGTQMNNEVLQRTFNTQTAEALQAKDILFAQITQASSLGNNGLSHDLLTQYNNLITQGVASGQLTPLQANTMQKKASDEIKLQDAIRTGKPITDDPTLETKRLSIYSTQQKAIEVNQLQNHFDFSRFILGTVAGDGTKAPNRMTDEQYMMAQQAQQGNQYLTLAKNTNTVGREQLFNQAGFMSLNPSIQRMVKYQFDEHTAKLLSNPDIALGLEGKGLSEIGDALVINKLSLKEVAKTQRFIQFQNAYETDPIGTIKAMKQEAGQYVQPFLSKLGVKDSASLAIDKVTDDPIYMAGLISPNSARTFTQKDYSNITIGAMNNLDPSSQKSIQEYIHVYSKANKSLELNDILKTKFDTLKINGSSTFVYKQDKNILDDVDNRKAISAFVSKKYNIDKNTVFEHGLQLNIQGNAYNLLDENKRIIASIPRESLRDLPSPNFFERKKHFFNGGK